MIILCNTEKPLKSFICNQSISFDLNVFEVIDGCSERCEGIERGKFKTIEESKEFIDQLAKTYSKITIVRLKNQMI